MRTPRSRDCGPGWPTGGPKHDDKGSTIGPDPFIPAKGGRWFGTGASRDRQDCHRRATRGVGRWLRPEPAQPPGWRLRRLKIRGRLVHGQGSGKFDPPGPLCHRRCEHAPNAGVCKVCWNHFQQGSGRDQTSGENSSFCFPNSSRKPAGVIPVPRRSRPASWSPWTGPSAAARSTTCG